MRVIVCMMTHEVYSGMRLSLLERSWESVIDAFPMAEVCLVDNSSTDGTDELVKEIVSLGGRGHAVSLMAGNTTPGAGRNNIIKFLNLSYDSVLDESLVVMSDDDIVWKSGAEAKLCEIWDNAPENLAIVSGLLEPIYHWNTPRRTIRCGGVPVLIRDSTPGAAWSMRGSLIRTRGGTDVNLGGVMLKNDFGYDYDLCCNLRMNGNEVGQLDLAEHIGWGSSTHGNKAIDDVRVRPLNREIWGV